MRIGLRESIRPEVKNTAINIYPSFVLQHVFIFMNGAIVYGHSDIVKPFSVLRIICKQTQKQIQLAPGLHNAEEFAEHFVLPLKIVKRLDTYDFCEIVVGRGNPLRLTTMVTHVREGAALLAR